MSKSFWSNVQIIPPPNGYKEFRERVHPGKVDEKYNFDDSVDRPQSKVRHESDP